MSSGMGGGRGEAGVGGRNRRPAVGDVARAREEREEEGKGTRRQEGISEAGIR